MKRIKQTHLILIIFLLALIIRLIFVIPSKDMPLGDAELYDRLGLSIATGLGFSNEDGAPHSFSPPFYPFFLSGIYRLFGHNYLAVRVIQSIIGAITCVFIYLVARKVCNANAGLWSAFISAIYPPFIKSAELLIAELFVTFILILIVFYLLEIQEGGGLKKCAALGLLLGISLLTKPMTLLLSFFIIPVFIYSNGASFSKILKRYLIVLSFFGLTILPWVIRNYNVHHRFVLVSTHGGLTFYSSYCPPGGIFGKNATTDDPVVVEANKISSPALKSDFFMKKAVSFILNNPKKVLALEFKKILYLWAPFDWEIVGGRWFNFIYVMALPFFAIGFLFAVKRLNFFYPILLPIIYFQIITLIFYGSPRFRLIIEPYLFILAIVGAMVIGKHISGKKGNKYEDICNNPGL